MVTYSTVLRGQVLKLQDKVDDLLIEAENRSDEDPAYEECSGILEDMQAMLDDVADLTQQLTKFEYF